jgi:hypothetical protein
MNDIDYTHEAEECYRRAAAVRRYAMDNRWPAARAELLEMEVLWLQLARSYEFGARFDRFLANVGKNANAA